MDFHGYFDWWVLANLAGLLFIVLALRWPVLFRVLGGLFFLYACWHNTTMALSSPQDYLGFGKLTFLPLYKAFIYGPFARNPALFVLPIALCQLFIGLSFFAKGIVAKLGLIGAIINLLAVAPLVFLDTILWAIAAGIVYTKEAQSRPLDLVLSVVKQVSKKS